MIKAQNMLVISYLKQAIIVQTRVARVKDAIVSGGEGEWETHKKKLHSPDKILFDST